MDEHEETDPAGVRVETHVFELTNKLELKMTQMQGAVASNLVVTIENIRAKWGKMTSE